MKIILQIGEKIILTDKNNTSVYFIIQRVKF